MNNRIYFTVSLLTLVTFAFLPLSFAEDDVDVIEAKEVLGEETLSERVEENTSTYIVRLIYFIPNDREAQLDMDNELDVMIKRTQKFYADELARHGFGSKTFRIETDDDNNAIVHHVDGKHNDAFYQADTFNKIFHELQGQVDFDNDIYVIAAEISSSTVDGSWGIGGNNKNGGYVLVPASGHYRNNVALIPHELGHAFGLQHYFFNAADIMSYGAIRENLSSKQLSLCNAEWLSVHPYFNSDRLLDRNLNTSINLISAKYDVKPPHTFKLRFELNDPDGLHQAQLIAAKGAALNDSSEPEFIGCQVLNGVRAHAEFATTRILDYVMIQVIDKEGNYTRRFFKIDATVPSVETDSVSIPDPNLASAIREALTIQPTQQITTIDMVRLQSLKATNRAITDLTGLEHAVGIESLDLTENHIQDLTPISELSLLRKLILNHNAIENLTPITKLTQLTELRIANSQIRDITPLANLTQLKVLVLATNRIRDITPLANLTQLTALGLSNGQLWLDPSDERIKPQPGFNEIRDLTPLANLTQLRQLLIIGNQVQDISPLANLTQLKNLKLGHNQIRDVTPLKNLKNLQNLVLQNNQIRDVRPLKGLVRLWQLYIDDNPPLVDLTGLEDMTRMKYLQVSNNPNITDITPLARMTQLVEFYAHDCKIQDITLLADKTQLKTLYLPGNQVTDITPLKRLTQLSELEIRDNHISDITPLAGMTQLKALYLPGNQVTDITPLKRLTQLHELNIGDNQISDITPLEGITQIKFLYLYNNQVSDVTPLRRLTLMEELIVFNNKISDARPLMGLVNLKFLSIWGNPLSTKEPLHTLLRLNPNMEIYHKKDEQLPVR